MVRPRASRRRNSSQLAQSPTRLELAMRTRGAHSWVCMTPTGRPDWASVGPPRMLGWKHRHGQRGTGDVMDGRYRDGDGAERAARRDDAVRAAVEQGLLGPGTPIVGLLDVTGIREAAAELRAAFDAVT